MNLRWLLFDFVDPNLELSRQERRRLRWRALDIMHARFVVPRRQRPSRWIVAAQCLSPSICCFAPLMTYQWIGGQNPWAMSAACFAGLLCAWLAVSWLARCTWKPAVAIALREMGHDVCGSCGYWLRGLSDDVRQCPECGEPREKSSSTPEVAPPSEPIR